MYDFHFGNKEEIINHRIDFLIFVKRLLPRWINGIPDSEYISIFKTLETIKNRNPILVETGCGASTIAMFLYCVLNNGHLYSWDTNGSKGSFLRTVISEAICRPLKVNIYDYWTFIAFDSTNNLAGIPVLEELDLKADFGYFDSWHTLDHLKNEIKSFEEVANNNFIIALDDAYYTKKSENYSYINMIRAKLNLEKVREPKQNICLPFYIEIENYLKSKYKVLTKVKDTYKQNYKNDIFFDYYQSDRNTMEMLGMESKEYLEHRYDAWSVEK